jgi:hypothetical protein
MNKPMSEQDIISRRKMLRNLGMAAGGAGFLAACGGSPSATAETAGNSAAEAPAAADLNLSDPSESLRQFTRIFGDTNTDNFSTGWFEGTVYAVIGDSDRITPLLGLEGIGTMRVLPVEGGGYRVFNRELAFYKDLRTGEFIDEWQNPLNGKLVETFPMHNMTVNAETAPILKMDIEGTELSVPFPASWRTVGDYIFSNFEIHASVPSELRPEEWPVESSGPMIRISEMFQRIVSKSDLTNEELTSVPYSGSWTRLSSWYPWMLMGQVPGQLYFRANTAKLGSSDDIPARFTDKAMQKHAAYLEPPTVDSWGQPNDSTFNTYMRERSPQPVE